MSAPCPTVKAWTQPRCRPRRVARARRENGEPAAPPSRTGPALSPSRAGRFHDLPAAVPVPGDRPAARAAEPGQRRAARWCTPRWSGCSTCPRPSGPRRPRGRCSIRNGTGWPPRSPSWPRCSRDEAALGRLAASPPPRSWTATSRWKTRAGSSRPTRELLRGDRRCDSGLRLRGYIDRLDVAPGGEIRIVDYKTGPGAAGGFRGERAVPDEVLRPGALAPARPGAEAAPAHVPGRGEIVRYAPDEADLRATERKIDALWQAIERARAAGDWRPRPSRLCDWCAHKALCPAFGGTPPPLPEVDDPAAGTGTTVRSG